MKTKKYELIEKHFVLLNSITTGKSNVSVEETQKKFKNVTRFLLVSAFTLFSSHGKAQAKTNERVYEKPYSASSIISLYGNERNKISSYIQRQSVNTAPIELQSNEIKGVSVNQDYFSGELFLNDGYKKNAKALADHNNQVHHYDNHTIILDGQRFENLSVYEILDKYALKDKNTDSDYLYDNVYYLFRDNTGNIIATVYYIDRTIGFLKTEYKVINKGKSPVTFPLIIAPNPARHVINITYQVGKQCEGSLQILDINGRAADTIFSGKQIESGTHTIQHNINLPAGNYLIRFDADGQAPVTQKLIVQ